ncbi:MAG: hypothetical protein ACR2P6_06335 [Gammaproteobacteria bacterium]
MCKLSDQFFSAVRVLSGERPIKLRLTRAYTEHLSDIACDQLPESSRRTFHELQIALSAVNPQPGESAAAASTRKMSVAEACRLADLIVMLFGELVRSKSTGEQLTLVEQFITENENPGPANSRSESHEPGIQHLS